jgi:hypothetical protein
MCLIRLILAVPVLLGLCALWALFLYAIGQCSPKKAQHRHPPRTVHAWRDHRQPLHPPGH